MKYSYGVNSFKPSSHSRGKSKSDTPFGRVTDVILDAFHPSYADLGSSQALYGVFYVQIGNSESEEDEDRVKFAYCSLSSFRRIPLKNEVVKLELLLSAEKRDISPTSGKVYWTDIIPIWNHPHVNAYPDTIQYGEGEVNLGQFFEEKSSINPLQLFPGDISLEGRHGQSLRFGGTNYDSNPWSTDMSNGDPFTILRNGQTTDQVKSGFETILEDINKDATSIYLMSNHRVELTQANSKSSTWSKKPVEVDQYKGAQILVNSDRIVINARNENILLSAKEDVGISCKRLNFDADTYIGLDAPKIYLGENAYSEQEPVLLGETTLDWLRSLLDSLKMLADTMGSTPTTPAVWIPAVMSTAVALQAVIPELEASLPALKSKKTFTE